MNLNIWSSSPFDLLQIPPLGAEKQIGDFDFSNEMKAMGTNLDMLKGRAQDTITAYRHSLSKGLEVFDPAVRGLFPLSKYCMCFYVDCS